MHATDNFPPLGLRPAPDPAPPAEEKPAKRSGVPLGLVVGMIAVSLLLLVARCGGGAGASP